MGGGNGGRSSIATTIKPNPAKNSTFEMYRGRRGGGEFQRLGNSAWFAIRGCRAEREDGRGSKLEARSSKLEAVLFEVDIRESEVK